MSKKADAYACDYSIMFFSPRNFGYSDGIFTFVQRRFAAPEDLWRYKDEEEVLMDGDGFVICSKCEVGGGKCRGDCEEEEENSDSE